MTALRSSMINPWRYYGKPRLRPVPRVDADGRKLVVLDLLEVERRLKARGAEFRLDCPAGGPCPTPELCYRAIGCLDRPSQEAAQ